MSCSRAAQKRGRSAGASGNTHHSQLPPTLEKMLDFVVANKRHQGKFIPTVGWVALLNTQGEGESVTEKQINKALPEWKLAAITGNDRYKNISHIEKITKSIPINAKNGRGSRHFYCIGVGKIKCEIYPKKEPAKTQWFADRYRRYASTEQFITPAAPRRTNAIRNQEPTAETPTVTEDPIAAANQAPTETPIADNQNTLHASRLQDRFESEPNGGDSLNNSQGTDTPQEQVNNRSVTPVITPQVPGLNEPENQWIKDMLGEYNWEAPENFNCKAFTD